MWGYSPLRNCPGVMRISIKLYIYIKQPAPRTWKSCTVRSTSLKLTRTSEVVLALGVQPRVCVSGWQRRCKIQHPAPIPWLLCYWYAIYANLPINSIHGFISIGKNKCKQNKNQPTTHPKNSNYWPLNLEGWSTFQFPGCWFSLPFKVGINQSRSRLQSPDFLGL